jgi:hypothetical protein
VTPGTKKALEQLARMRAAPRAQGAPTPLEAARAKRDARLAEKEARRRAHEAWLNPPIRKLPTWEEETAEREAKLRRLDAWLESPGGEYVQRLADGTMGVK